MPTATVYPHVLHGNVVRGWAMQGADTEEEVKVIAGDAPRARRTRLRMSVTTVRVPVTIGHSAAVWVELDTDAHPDDVRMLVARVRPGIVIVDDPAAQRTRCRGRSPAPMTSRWGGSARDTGTENGIALFFSADNLRKGAATNAVQVAELLLRDR